MSNSIFGIGASGLAAAQAGIATAGHNISNAATPGYNRQQIVQTTQIPQYSGIGFLGQGVQVETVRRIYDGFLANQVMAAEMQGGELSAYYARIQAIDRVLSDQNAGLSPALQEFFNRVQDVASDPAASVTRQALLSAAESLVARFHSIDGQLAEMQNGVAQLLRGSITNINAYTQQIATLNQDILLVQAGGNGNQPPNDMLDQRDALIAALNLEIRATVVKQDDGSYNVFVGNGQALVMGPQAFGLQAIPSLANPGRTDVGYVTPGGVIALREDNLQGGKLGGLLKFRTLSLDGAQDAVGRIALGLAETFNAQHRLGQDLAGALGGDFFAAATPNVVAHTLNSPASTLSASISDSNALPPALGDYKFSFDGSNYTLMRLSDNVSVSSASAPTLAAPMLLDGVSVTGASLNAGESFLIQPARNGARDIALAINDPRRIAAASPLKTAAALANSGAGKIVGGEVTARTGLPLAASPGGDITLVYDSALKQFNVTGGPGGVLVFDPATESAGKTFSFAVPGGYSFTLSGVPAHNDSFSISSNVGSVADNRNALLLGALQMKNTLMNGSASYQSAYSQLVGEVGNKTRQLQVTSSAQASLIEQVKSEREAVSGVNLDEEAANLLRYQQAYQASGKVMQIANSLFATLLDIAR